MASGSDSTLITTGNVVVSDYERFDGAHWQTIDTLDGTTVVTSVGRSYFAANNVAQLLHAYREDVLAGRNSAADTRRYLAEGGNGRVYTVGDSDLVVKEKLPQSHVGLRDELERMDLLTDAIEKHCPRWITMPALYALYLPSEDLEKQYMLMQKIDHGVTVGDVLDIGESRPRENHLAEAALRVFGTVGPELKAELRDHYEEMKDHVTNAAYMEGQTPGPTGNVLVDIKPYNVIVEPVTTPIAGSNFRFTVIDQ